MVRLINSNRFTGLLIDIKPKLLTDGAGICKFSFVGEIQRLSALAGRRVGGALLSLRPKFNPACSKLGFLALATWENFT